MQFIRQKRFIFVDMFELFKTRVNPKYKKKQLRNTMHHGSFMGVGTPRWVASTNGIDLVNNYLGCPPLYSGINLLASAFTRGRYEHGKIQSNGKHVPFRDSELVAKLNNPNPLQGRNEFLKQNYIFWQVVGNSQIYNVNLNRNIDNVNDYNSILNLWNLPAYIVQYVTTGSVYTATSLSDIISKVVVNGDYARAIDPAYLMLLNDNSVKEENGQYVLGDSKVRALNKPISNIIAILEAENVLTTKHGALGILTNEGKNDMGPAEVGADDKQDIQDQYRDYGLSRDQWQVIITSANLKWQQMSLPIKELMFTERYKSAKVEILNGLEVPPPLVGEYKSAAGQANMDKFERQMYQNKVIPDWTQFESVVSNYFDLREKKEYFKIRYDHIEVLQKDRKFYVEVGNIKAKTILEVQASVAEGNTSADSAVAIIAETVTEGDRDRAIALLGSGASGDASKQVTEVNSKNFDSLYAAYASATNMTHSELLKWSEDNKEIGEQDRAILGKSLVLLSVNKTNWTEEHYSWAAEIVEDVNRFKSLANKTKDLKHRAYNPDK